MFERMAGPDLWKEKPGRLLLECSALTAYLTQLLVSLLEGRMEQLLQNRLTLGRLHPRWQVPSSVGPGLGLVTLSHSSLGLPGTGHHL